MLGGERVFKIRFASLIVNHLQNDSLRIKTPIRFYTLAAGHRLSGIALVLFRVIYLIFITWEAQCVSAICYLYLVPLRNLNKMRCLCTKR